VHLVCSPGRSTEAFPASIISGRTKLPILIGKRSRTALREYFVGTSLRIIDDAFDAAEIRADRDYEPQVGGQRRRLVEQYYHTLDWTRPSDARKFLAVAEGVIAELDVAIAQYPANADAASADRARILSALASDGCSLDGGRFNTPPSASQLEDIAASAVRLDAPELHRQIERMRASVEGDPGLTVGTAKELVETACKTILDDHGRTVDPEWDIGRLMKETREALKLLPSDIPDSARGAESIKRLLANLGSVVQALGELRNLYGTGHGRSGRRRGISSRHARLASGTATALVTFLLETHWERTE